MKLARDHFIRCFGLMGAVVLIGCQPTVTIGTPSVSDTADGPVTYTITYANTDAITLADGDVTLNASDSADGTVVVSGDGDETRTVTISDISGDGTLGISIAADTASDDIGNTALAAGPSATFNVDNTPPAVVVSAPSAELTTHGPVTYTVTYPDASDTTLTEGDVTLEKTDTADGTLSLSAKGAGPRTVTISDTVGIGTLGISIAADTAVDLVGNLALGAVSAIFEVYNKYNSMTESFMLPGNVPLIMVPIPAGSFTMGSENGSDDEIPVHSVTLTQDFQLGQTEVTKAQWEAVMGTTPWSGQLFVLDDPNAPATHVSWNDAQDFIAALNKLTSETFRLPTEAEWEYGCRVGTTTEYHFGDDPAALNDYAWFEDNSYEGKDGYAHVVAQLLPNPYGLFDTHGNVFEWCQDLYDSDYYLVSPATDPPGPASGTNRVTRGGGWAHAAAFSRAAARFPEPPLRTVENLGFRLARSPNVKTFTLGDDDVPLRMGNIPAGTFNMGSTVVGGDAIPVHSVTLTQDFQLGQTEVTKAQWEAVMGSTPWSGQPQILDEPNTPATHVSWNDAQAFITAVNTLTGETFRLPTEAEWEYGCRAGSTTEYYYGDSTASLHNYAWYSADNRGFADFVAQKLSNPFGLFDTHGNVWEWCEDWYDSGYYSVSPEIDPEGPTSGSIRVFRGGGWGSDEGRCRSARRDWDGPDVADTFIGFRLAR